MLPQPVALFPAGDPSDTSPPPPPFSDATESQLATFKAAAWTASTAALMPQPQGGGGRRRKAAAAAAAAAAATPEGLAVDADSPDRLSVMVSQLLKMLGSPSAATVCGGVRAIRAVVEARAHAAAAAGDSYTEDARVTELMNVRPARSCSCAV